MTMRILTASLLAIGLVGCAGQTGIESVDLMDVTYSMDESELVQSPPSDPQDPNFQFEKLSWEEANPANKRWSNYVFRLIERQELDSLDQADDAERFCPNYRRLTRLQKVNFWGALISAKTRFESSYRPTTRMTEPQLGNDPTTGQVVVSEGLMQLSYQDARRFKFCRFNWERDRHLAANDPRKTILDPYINLECGIKILSRQVIRRKQVVLREGAYWSVIKEGHRNQKIDQIAEMTRRLPFCQ